MNRALPLALLAVAVVGSSGCQSAYYKTMESFGVHKRDLLVGRVESARDAQSDAAEQFDSALEQFQSVLGSSGGELQDKYETLKAALDRSESRAAAVGDRVDAVEQVADALFDEWEDELDQYTNRDLRRSSAKQLEGTRSEYERLMKAMRRAESKIEPVLTVFRDQVLFLKHNLNAQAVASLRSELGTVESEVESLVREMKRSMAEADAFISKMGAGGA